jgi:hypothetical protein
MKTTRFETNTRLWFWIASGLFAISWFLPMVTIKGSYFSMATGLKELVGAIQREADSETRLFSRVLSIFVCLSILISIVVGWLLHCFIIIIRSRKREG